MSCEAEQAAFDATVAAYDAALEAQEDARIVFEANPTPANQAAYNAAIQAAADALTAKNSAYIVLMDCNNSSPGGTGT